MLERILIMTDSSNTISQEDAKKYEIAILPLTLERSDNKIFIDEPSAITSHDILEMIDQGFTFKTATTILGIMEQKIQEGLENYDKIIICPISKGWSSQTSHLEMIAKNYPDRVFVADTKDYGYSLECLCIELREMINNGVEIPKLLEYANNHWKYSLSLFACKNLKGLEKSGRLPKIIAKALSLTKITPIIKAEYNNQKEGLALGWGNVLDKFIVYLDKNYKKNLNKDTIKKMCVLISEDSSADINKLRKMLSEKYQISEDEIVLRWAPNVFLCIVWKGAIGVTTISNIEKSILPNLKD